MVDDLQNNNQELMKQIGICQVFEILFAIVFQNIVSCHHNDVNFLYLVSPSPLLGRKQIFCTKGID